MEKKVQIPGTDYFAITQEGSFDRVKKVIMARGEFIQKYCKEKGWPDDPLELSFEQILEIRSQQEWIDAGK